MRLNFTVDLRPFASVKHRHDGIAFPTIQASHASIIPTPFSESKPMNLRSSYGDKYRIAREEGADRHDPAGFIIPCKRGHIYVHGRELLGVATNGRDGPLHQAGRVNHSRNRRRAACVKA
jgi:hypothetical protein